MFLLNDDGSRVPAYLVRLAQVLWFSVSSSGVVGMFLLSLDGVLKLSLRYGPFASACSSEKAQGREDGYSELTPMMELQQSRQQASQRSESLWKS